MADNHLLARSVRFHSRKPQRQKASRNMATRARQHTPPCPGYLLYRQGLQHCCPAMAAAAPQAAEQSCSLEAELIPTLPPIPPATGAHWKSPCYRQQQALNESGLPQQASALAHQPTPPARNCWLSSGQSPPAP